MNSFKTFLSILLISCSVVLSTAQVKIGQGVTSPNDWVDYNSTGIYVDVDTKSCSFNTTPHYLVTLESIGNKGYHWYISGAPSLYNVTPTGFRVYLRWTDAPSDLATIPSLNFPNPLRASTAKNREWVIRWTGIEMADCNPSRENLNVVSRIFSGPNGPEGDNISIKNPPKDELKEPILYPNPGKSKIEVYYDDRIIKSEIYDMNSRLLTSSTTNSLNISNLPKGNYLVKVYLAGGEILNKKFVK